MWWLIPIGALALGAFAGLGLARLLLKSDIEPWEARWDPRRVDPRGRSIQ